MSESLFPEPGDKLFEDPSDWWSTACLNWFRDGWSIYADGYRNGADTLVESVITTGRQHDTLVYPIVFLYRQYLELELKGLISDCKSLQDLEGGAPRSHRLKDLWSDCRGLLTIISPGEAEGELDQVERLIFEFSEVDPGSVAFRYPETQDGRPSLPGMKNINLRLLRTRMGQIHNLLDAARSQIAHYLGIKSEMLAEVKGEGNARSDW